MESHHSLVQVLREQIDRKHRDAIGALEVLRDYLEAAAIPNGATVPEKKEIPEPDVGGYGSRVDVVLASIQKEFKTVTRIGLDTGLSEDSVRAVLYGKAVHSKLQSRSISGKKAFRLKPAISAAQGGHGAENVAELVRSAFRKHPEGLTAGQLMDSLSTEHELTAAFKKAVGAALYNMTRKSKKLSHNAESGVYKMI